MGKEVQDKNKPGGTYSFGNADGIDGIAFTFDKPGAEADIFFSPGDKQYLKTATIMSKEEFLKDFMEKMAEAIKAAKRPK